LEKKLNDAKQVLQGLQGSDDTIAIRDATAMVERGRRNLLREPNLPKGDTMPVKLWTWKLGTIVFIGIPSEPFAEIQLVLRERFPQYTIIIGTLCNGTDGYMMPEKDYGTGLYQEWISPAGKGCLEVAIEALTAEIENL
ncbi:MAG: hypothetical protein HRT89_17075, partial [Lentisphaeria bacterium]|nr:hypothetical protein [Lentisphaeria bacterium]